jgi:lipopolysaccharide export system permease protein
VTVLNPVGAAAYRTFEVEKARLLSEEGDSPMPNGLWIRQATPQGQVVIHADAWGGAGAQLTDVTLLFFTEREGALRFSRRMQAAVAELKPGFWQLTDIVEAEPGGRPQREDNLAIPTTLDPSELLNRFVAPATLSFWELPGFIAESQAAGLAPVRYELKWQSLLAYPLLLAGMAGLGAVFSLRLQRLGNVAAWSAAGVGIGLFLFFFSQLSAAFAVSQAAPPFVAAWSPPLAGLFTALAFVAYLEDG